MIWRRDDAFFALPRMEAHIFDGGHFLLGTHAAQAAALMAAFIKRTESENRL
jgi:surfactin synthase thioesterase subunit